MSETYRSRQLEGTASHVVVIHCSDPRYQPHFQDFLHTGLGLARYGLIAIPGGVEMLSPSESSETVRGQGAAWFDFMLKLMSAQRCILIGHADCRWYVESKIEPDESRLKQHQLRDLDAVQEEIHRLFPRVKVEIYFAELEGSQVSFTVVEQNPAASRKSATHQP
jgi:hypothetical protein